MNLILRLLISAATAYGLTYVLDGIHFTDFKGAVFFALLMAVLNTILKPILVVLTIPITIITLGLFLLVINAGMILLADHWMDSLKVDGFWWALVFSILLSIVSGALNSLFQSRSNKGR
jgi:putative membrane protein